MLEAKTEKELEAIREGGRILSQIIGELAKAVRPGIGTGELERMALDMMSEAGGQPSFKGYGGSRKVKPFPTAICASLNHEVVHGFSLPSKTVRDGDLLKIDAGLRYRGCYTDMAVTVGAGKVGAREIELARVTREALILGVEQVRHGAWVSDIGKAIDRHVRRHGFSTVKDLVGHGVGRAVHEDPQIPNYLDRRSAPIRLFRNLVLAIEPMVNMGGEEVNCENDGWTVTTADRSLSAHFEMTVIVGQDGPEIVTPLPDFFA
ncbi:type I methionyl aminopeptidase [Candidatus Uhrbacteria bacterium]|nr:type I methionyl aminopeptidase [Candidatus Uhrbacteria bacterium]